MQEPASPPKFTRTCPACGRPVEPGNKFCATCGTMMPVLLTCSKCGTQFIEPLKYCDLCGAPLILEPGNSPEYSEEENTGPVEDQTSEQDNGEIPEPDTDELTDDAEQENIITARQETPHHYQKKIQEPDTDELLEQYGKEYAEDETLESTHVPNPTPSTLPKAKKPVAVPAPPERGPSETIDDALFLSPVKPGSAAKPRLTRTRIIGGCVVLIAIVAIVYFVGLPMLSAQSNPPVGEITPMPTISGTNPPTLTVTPTPVSRALVPLPTQLIPSGQKLYFTVQKNPVTQKILVIFAGSAGVGSIISADIKVTHPVGSVAAGIIMPLKGVSEITLDGSKEADRVEIIAHMSDGKAYRVYDQLVP
jgi:hypothetical protein